MRDHIDGYGNSRAVGDNLLEQLDQMSIAGSPTPPDSLLFSSPSPSTQSAARPRRPRRRYAQASQVIVHVEVKGGTNPITINAMPSAPDERRAPGSAAAPVAPATISPSSPVTYTDVPVYVKADPTTITQAAREAGQNVAEPSNAVRGGGRVAAWNPALEHIEPADPSHRGKWYVVTAGRRVGIWCSWLDMEDYVDVKGRRFQGFITRAQAEHHYNLAKEEGRVRLLVGERL
ncbi:hypothetical protein TRAPUB_9372 [Trametes pubescens]|uniref:Ribonuclease H1 N-terminal domain-containing protein n=1 Tax=Trametes pubescens TaxID=154538 RepID=A0A1M2W2P3_TRAPU|nr:hypothetical protein TRAPUB_9372 [Trametes pubescens]